MSENRPPAGWAPYGSRAGVRALLAISVSSSLVLLVLGIVLLVQHRHGGRSLTELAGALVVALILLFAAAKARGKV